MTMLRHSYWLTAMLVMCGIAAITIRGYSSAAAGAVALPSLAASCLTDTPYFVAAMAPRRSSMDALVAFRDRPYWTSPDYEEPPGLVSADAVGTVYGLAVDVRASVIYVAALHHEQYASSWPLGPGGIGAIYRMDPASGEVGLWTTIDAGLPGAKDWSYSGKVGLGDIDYEPTSNTLMVANLRDRTIVRLSVPDGRVIGTIPHGARGEPWAPNARIFGLGTGNGWLYHGVVDSREDTTLPGELAGYVYRSKPNGADMREVVRFTLDYRHAPRWRGWTDADPLRIGMGNVAAQPLIVDIAPTQSGDLLIGLRDRVLFVAPWGIDGIPTSGDLLLAECDGDRCSVVSSPGRYGFGGTFGLHGERLIGSLATHPREDWVVTRVRYNHSDGGALWLDAPSGRYPQEETIRRVRTLLEGELHDVGGDIEAFCGSAGTVHRVYLPSARQRGSVCRPVPANVIVILDMSTTMRQPAGSGKSSAQVALESVRSFVRQMPLAPRATGDTSRIGIVAFNNTAWTEQVLTDQEELVAAALDRLPAKMAEGSRIDLGLVEAKAAALPTANDGQRVFGILVSDGIPNRVPPGPDGSPDSTVRGAAREFESLKGDLFVVGTGLDGQLNAPLLRSIASDATTFYWATDSDDLASIWAEIARRLSCR